MTHETGSASVKKIDANDIPKDRFLKAVEEAFNDAPDLVMKHSESSLDYEKELKDSVNYVKPYALYNYKSSEDTETLLGQRWLCKGGSCFLIGQTGVGKSSFTMQAAITWAMGLPLFGITPTRPLKSLIIQAENDHGDLAEAFQGVIKGLNYESSLDEINTNITFVTEAGKTGDSFLEWIPTVIEQVKPDLVWVDPFYSFFGGNVSEQRDISPFLRNGLGSIAHKTGITWMVVHHTNKPVKKSEKEGRKPSGDYAYVGSGSAELANWARAVLSLQQIDEGLFELRASKRGKRAGLIDANSNPATVICLKQSQRGICWEIGVTEESKEVSEENEAVKREESEHEDAQEIIAAMEAGKHYEKTELQQLAIKTLGGVRSNYNTTGKRGWRVLTEVMRVTQNIHNPSVFCKTPVYSNGS